MLAVIIGKSVPSSVSGSFCPCKKAKNAEISPLGPPQYVLRSGQSRLYASFDAVEHHATSLKAAKRMSESSQSRFP